MISRECAKCGTAFTNRELLDRFVKRCRGSAFMNKHLMEATGMTYGVAARILSDATKSGKLIRVRIGVYREAR